MKERLYESLLARIDDIMRMVDSSLVFRATVGEMKEMLHTVAYGEVFSNDDECDTTTRLGAEGFICGCMFNIMLKCSDSFVVYHLAQEIDEDTQFLLSL